MTIDDAIQHCEEVAEKKKSQVPYKIYDDDEWSKEQKECMECAENHLQLADWLKELKMWREGILVWKKGEATSEVLNK